MTQSEATLFSGNLDMGTDFVIGTSFLVQGSVVGGSDSFSFFFCPYDFNDTVDPLKSNMHKTRNRTNRAV